MLAVKYIEIKIIYCLLQEYLLYVFFIKNYLKSVFLVAAMLLNFICSFIGIHIL
jgi:hypothetical protein